MALRELTAQFSKRLNRLQSPVHSLPADLLHEIFMIVAPDEPPNATTIGWVKLGHVCSFFRQILVECCRTLWAQNVSSIPRASMDFLQRSGDTPITIDIATDEEDILGFALVHIAQARHIIVRHEEACITIRDALIGSYFPLLEKLCMDACPHLAVDGPRPAADDLPDHNLGSTSFTSTPLGAPKLRYLHLRGIYIPFSPETLVHLGLEHILAEIFDGSAEPLLDILKCCHLLQRLHMRWALPSIPSRTSSHGERQTIHLSHLRNIFVEDEESRSEAFWSILSIPTTAAVTFIHQALAPSRGMEISADRIVPAFAAHARDCDPVGLRVMFRFSTGVPAQESSCLYVSVFSHRDHVEPWSPWDEPMDLSHLLEPEGNSLNLLLTRNGREDLPSQAMVVIGTTLFSGIRDPSSIRFLEISFVSRMNEDALRPETIESHAMRWQQLLFALPAIETLTLHGFCIPPMRILRGETGNMVVPRLHTLCIAHALVLPAQSPFLPYGVELGALIEVLRQRAAAGSPLRSLRLPEIMQVPATFHGGQAELDIQGELSAAFEAPDWPGERPVFEYSMNRR